jgi:hypothetical protein
LQYHPLLWWAGLRKVREKYHIYIYQWHCRIVKEICIKYHIICLNLLNIMLQEIDISNDKIKSVIVMIIYLYCKTVK